MELHPTHGAEKLVQLKEFKRLPLRAIHVALEHHIKEDDTGYPHYFKKETTNLFSKIVKVVDYFDAITTKTGLPEERVHPGRSPEPDARADRDRVQPGHPQGLRQHDGRLSRSARRPT